MGGGELPHHMSRGYSVLSYWTPGGIVSPFSEKEKKRWSYLPWAKENGLRLLNQAVISKLWYISFNQDIIHIS